jgi:thiamine-monophosphate kinase
MPFFIMDKKNFQEIKEIGFSSLIERLKNYSGVKRDEVLKGIGDDAAIFRDKDGYNSCITSEIFLEGVHFDLTYTPFHHLGYKIVTAAVSDIYAVNGEPVQLLINIAIPNKYSVQMIEQLYKGIHAASEDYNIEVSGGDTTASHQVLSISVTALGSVKKDDVIYRDGAKHEDIICVTGDLGSSLAGLRILMREKKEWKEKEMESFQPDISDYEYVVKRQLLPAARKDLIEAINESGIKPTAMIDLSQGLMADLRSLAKASGLGSEVYAPAIPITLDTRKVADEMKEDVDKYAFYGGEEFEMLFTLPENQIEKFRKSFDDFAVIGKMTNQFKQLKINTGEGETIQIETE